jgi:alginate O-acetyltransferase complex protein AlgI
MMVFSSETFLFIFLPAFLIVYYLVPANFRSLVIVVGSYLFYAWWRVDFLVLFFLTTVWTYGFGLLVARYEGTKLARTSCTIGIVGCLSVLGFFKYFNFFVDNTAAILGITPHELGIEWRVILPIGVSFYVFHSISYLVDVYRKDAPPARNFLDFAAFVSLFPQLVAGPILRFKDLSSQFVSRTHSFELFSQGVTIFVIGLAKKVLIADSVAPLTDTLFQQTNPTFVEAWIGAIAYTIQLYFDFSGYSEMAVGLGLMIGFRLIANFDTPYISRSITEFWRRWHISLSVWLRDYLYIPLGGNRGGVVRTYFNLIIVMVLGGLWHGANWTFILWGTGHGLVLALERAFGWPKKSVLTPWALPLTLSLVVIGWVMFRSPDVATALDFYSGMLGQQGFGIRQDIAWQISRESLSVLAIGVALVFMEPSLRSLWVPKLQIDGSGAAVMSVGLGRALAMSALTVLILMRLAEQSYSPFLYFQF